MVYLSSSIQTLLLVCVTRCSARHWSDIVSVNDVRIQHIESAIVQFEADPFEEVDNEPNNAPPSNSPIVHPLTTVPIAPPVASPVTPSPTNHPSDVPSQSATLAPTLNPYPENEPPSNPPSSYFNYNSDRTNNYGPGYPQLRRHNSTMLVVGYDNNGWSNADVPNDYYWSEFDDPGFGPWQGVLAPRIPTRNRCGRIGKQSPIDLKPSGAKCWEHHEVRSLPGDFKIGDAAIQKQIMSNKLRLQYQRRPCADLLDEACAEPDPPHADFPHNWGGYADLMHVDFKVPSEHLIDGERFDAEMQVFHLHPGRRRTPTLSVLIRASPTGYNTYLQPALDAFEYEYNVHRSQCAQSGLRNRHLVMDANKTDALQPEELDSMKDRLLQKNGVWDPHNEALVPSIHFYGYEGSLTEPPCGEWVSWFVADKPMMISEMQLEQMKRLIFTHISPTCEKTSVHFRQSVARPIQDAAARRVWHCTSADFGPDR